MVDDFKRRDGPRLDLRMRVRYTPIDGGQGFTEAESSDISPHGLRLESETPLEVGGVLVVFIDTGDDEEFKTQASVTWCQHHISPTGRTIYDIGMRFHQGLLTQERGPMGSALAKIFLLNRYEPARSSPRIEVNIRAILNSSVSKTYTGMSTIVDLSTGGLQLTISPQYPEELKIGHALWLKFEGQKSLSLQGRIAWLAGDTKIQRCGIAFHNVDQETQTYMQSVLDKNIAIAAVHIIIQSN